MASKTTQVEEADAPPIAFACPECGKALKARAELMGKKVKCPKCRTAVLVPEPEIEIVEEAEIPEPAEVPDRRFWLVAGTLLVLVIFGSSIYVNLSFAVTNRQNYQYFPPFKRFVDANDNKHLGAEYYNIAESLVAGEGFSSPWNNEKTGPTAWMPPLLPGILAAFLWICDGNKDAVMAIVIFLQVYVLIGTGILVLALVRQTTTRIWALAAAVVFLAGVCCDFRQWFQHTHDCWLILLAVDLLVAGLCWFGPLQSWKRSIAWGLFGGLCAMINPIVAMAWGVSTVVIMFRERAWYRFGVVALIAALTITPWIVRNYLVFGRFIPVKSNAAYELYQSQCLQKDGLLRDFAGHPYGSAGRERQEYKALGEMAFVDKKKEIFWKAVREDPLEFADRVSCRFLGATLWYVPFNRQDITSRPWITWTNRLVHPLPFLALLFLGFTVVWRPLPWSQWSVMGVYLLYLLPYIGVSYYDRYAIPLLAVKILLVLWAADRVLRMLFGEPRER